MCKGDDRRRTVQVPSTFDEFYRSEYHQIVALMYAMTGSTWIAEELAQEAFLRISKDWHRIEDMDAPRGYLRRTAANLAQSRWRRLRAEALARTRLGAMQASLQHPIERHVGFWDEVRKLPRRQAQVIALRYVDDLTTPEIAEVLGIAEGTVRASLHQGRARLERQLDAKGWGREG